MVVLRIQTPLRTRFAVARRSSVSAAFDAHVGPQLQRIDASALALPGVDVLALEPMWAQNLLRSAVLVGATNALFADIPPDCGVVLSLRPGAIVFSVGNPVHDRIGATVARRWLDSLLAVLRIAEAGPPPQLRAEPTALERLADDPVRTQRFAVIAVIVALVGVFGMAFLAAAVVLATFWLRR